MAEGRTPSASRQAFPLDNPMRPYAWGSHTLLPELLGVPNIGDQPWAEIWMGAHPGAPSVLPDGRSLAEVAPELPFLVKLLASEKPLSIQAHPDLAQARAGFDAEEARHIPPGAPERCYKDPNHKPELLVALTEVSALCGFREPTDVLHLAALLGSAAFSALVAPLRGGSGSLRSVFEQLLRTTDHGELVDEVSAACAALLARGSEGEEDGALEWVARLAEDFPGDPGVLAPLLLELIVLEPGDGLFIGAGVLHVYLRGAGVEVMASSDNVLRGGLTPKHVDVAELLRVVRFEVGTHPVVRPQHVGSGVDAYPVPVPDFAVWRVSPSDLGPATVQADGPRIVVCVEGSVEVGGVRLEPGRSAYVPADPGLLTVYGDGTCFVVSAAD